MTQGQPKVFGQQIESSFGIIEGFPGYISKPEITGITPAYLVPGSKNVLIDYASRIISRNGYKLYRQANTGGVGFKSSYEWQTSTGSEFSLRGGGTTLEFDWNNTYNTLLSGLASPYMEFVKVLDYAEQQDVLLMVMGDGYFRRWSGGVSTVRSSTAITLTKQGVLTAVTTIAFVAGVTGITAPTITDSALNFLNAGFAAGDTLTITGSTGNSSIFTIASVTAGVITLIMSNILVSEAVGQTITLYNQTGPTWKSARFFSTISGRSIRYQGVDYTYTGGEGTDTLTGLIAFPAVAVGDPVWQTMDRYAVPSAITSPFPNFFPNLIGVQLNMVFVGSTSSPMIFGSKASDYTNFTLTSPRAPGDPVQQPLTDGPCTCIIPIDNATMQLNVLNTLIFGSGRDTWDQIDFHMSQDNTEELLRIIRYKTAKGSGLISKGAICPIKNNTIYISREPALDGLSESNLEAPDGRRNVPISDPIKNDFDTYNFTDAHVIYYKRQILIALPTHGIVLIYDLMRNLWQPPQYMPVGRFAIIKDVLYGHSSVTNETYQLFVGTDDNGVFIPMVARFAYNNGGRRDRLKNLSLYWSDGYITANGLLNLNTYFGFNGSRGYKTKTIAGNDSKVVTSPTGVPFGNIGFGKTPFGGATGKAIAGLPGANTTLLRFWQVNPYKGNDYIEQFTEYTQNVLGAQFALVAHGSDQFDAGTAPVGHTK